MLDLLTLAPTGARARLELHPLRMRRLRLERAAPEARGWLAAVLARCGAELGTSVAIEPDPLVLRW